MPGRQGACMYECMGMLRVPPMQGRSGHTRPVAQVGKEASTAMAEARSTPWCRGCEQHACRLGAVWAARSWQHCVCSTTSAQGWCQERPLTDAGPQFACRCALNDGSALPSWASLTGACQRCHGRRLAGYALLLQRRRRRRHPQLCVSCSFCITVNHLPQFDAGNLH